MPTAPKRLLWALIVVCLLCSLSATPVFAKTDLILNSHEDMPTLNAIANVQRMSGQAAVEAVNRQQSPGIALCAAGEIEDLEAFLLSCHEAKTVPVLQVETKDEGAKLVNALTAASFKDATVISADPTVLASIRNRKTLVRTGLIVTLEKDSLTSKEAATIRENVRQAPATFCVLQSEQASRAVVSELQELAVAVWVDVDDTSDSDTFRLQAARALTSGANGIITDNASKLAALANEWLADDAMTRTPVMIGHRGNPSQAPENSLTGFLTAYENGADVFELDAEITKDGEIIIMHDSTLNRTTNYDGESTINEMTLSQVKKYCLLDNNNNVSDEPVPTLREVLETFRDKDCRIFVEFKGYNQDNVIKTAAIIRELDMADRVDVISFNANLIKTTQKELPGMSTGLLQSSGGYTNNPVAASKELLSALMTAQAAQSSINPNNKIMSDAFMQAATDRGITIWPWTYSATTNDEGFLQCPDGITTDDMQWVTAMLKSVEAQQDTVRAVVGKPIDAKLRGIPYGGDAIALQDADLTVSVVDGDDCVAIVDGVLEATASGKATVIVGCHTKTTDGSAYVLYTEPFTVTVNRISPIVWIIIGGVLVLIGGVGMALWLKRRKAA